MARFITMIPMVWIVAPPAVQVRLTTRSYPPTNLFKLLLKAIEILPRRDRAKTSGMHQNAGPPRGLWTVSHADRNLVIEGTSKIRFKSFASRCIIEFGSTLLGAR